MSRSLTYRSLRVITIIVFLLLIGSLIIYFNPGPFSQIHQGNFTAWLIMHFRHLHFATFWIWLLIPLMLFIAINTITCIFTRLKSGKKGIASTLFHLGFVLALLGFCLDSTFGIRGQELCIKPGEQMEIPGFAGLSLKMTEIVPVWTTKGRGTFPGTAQANFTLLKGEKILKERTVGPNRPLLYRGKAVYLIQSGKAWTGIRLKIDNRETEINLGEVVSLSNQPYKIRLDRIVPHLGIDKDGKVFSQSRSMLNPAGKISLIPIQEGKHITSGWLFQNFSHMNPLSEKGISVKWLSNLKGEEAIVHFGNHPGLGLVLAGVFLAFIGTLLLLLRPITFQKSPTPSD